MIAKIKNTDSSYSYFEGDAITACKHNQPIGELKKMSSPDVLFIVSGENEKETPTISLHFYRNHKCVQWLFTNHRCYLMNEEGKTIDKLF